MTRKKPFVKVSINGGTPIMLSLKQFFPVCTKILYHEGASKEELKRAMTPALNFLNMGDGFFSKRKKKLINI